MDDKYSINTWSQGYFVDNPKYSRWSEAEKRDADLQEHHLVRPSPLENSICYCGNPEDAIWIAKKLNEAANMRNALMDIVALKDFGDDSDNQVVAFIVQDFAKKLLSKLEP